MTELNRPLFGSATRAACRLFFTLAAAGFITSVAVHLVAWFGFRIPGAMSLHLGIFVVWIPTVLVATRLNRNHANKDFWKASLRWCPRWAERGVLALFGYAVLNFGVSLLLSHVRSGSPSEAETARIFSGHWMVFYGVAAAVLYSAIHAVDDRRRCPNGHLAPASARFCEECGTPVAATDPAPSRALVR